MRLISINNLRTGACLGKSIYDTFGRVLLRKGTVLTENYIQKLRDLEYKSVYVDDGVPESMLIEDIVSQETRIEALKITKEALINTKTGSSLQERKIKQMVNEIIDEILSNRETLVHLIDIRSMQNYLFSHSVNVCILSLMTGLSLGYNQLRLRELGVGALLHDIGKVVVLDEIHDQNKLTQEIYQLIQRHCDYGFDILRKADNISIIAAHVAWQHHERYDGSGYPRKLSGKGIQEFARIVAIANVYDDLTNDRPGRDRILPHEVIEIINLKSGLDFDPDLVSHFISNIAPYPTGSLVTLNSCFEGTVVSVNKNNPTRPKVKLLYDDIGQEIKELTFVDLMKDTSLFITKVAKE